jgi:hypothetical protein
MQEAIGYPALYNDNRLIGPLLGVIAEHVCQHVGVA